jgi:hypothetical protein
MCDKVVCERVAYERVLFENVVCVCEKDTKAMWMSPSATHATQSAAAPRATMQTQAPHQSQPNAASATQKGRQCHQVTDLLKFHFSIYISNRWIFVVNPYEDRTHV